MRKMAIKTSPKAIVGFLIFLAFPMLATAANPITERLSGELGHSSKWGSGWLDLDTATSFSQGDRLKLKIGGTAEKILVRLLPEGTPPDSSAGIVGDAISVPPNRLIEITLNVSRKSITQISVHGGPNPWGRFLLGGGNGPATLEYVDCTH